MSWRCVLPPDDLPEWTESVPECIHKLFWCKLVTMNSIYALTVDTCGNPAMRFSALLASSYGKQRMPCFLIVLPCISLKQCSQRFNNPSD